MIIRFPGRLPAILAVAVASSTDKRIATDEAWGKVFKQVGTITIKGWLP